ncbi:fused MFS/spermidine synthase [candidate division KSB1 bacterium]|nr:fused MFS/spermidine synthase [candidate division KSB1 bacterium]
MKFFTNSILVFLFIASGFSALVYEILWIKYFSFILGNTTYTLSVVFASYLAGLALGSYVFGRVAKKNDNPLLLYALLELSIGITCLVLYFLFNYVIKDLAPVGVLNNENIIPILQRFLITFFILLVPTFLMGGTLPVLTKHFYTGEAKAGLTVGGLYGINTLGSSIGCFVTGFFFIRLFGLSKTTFIAVTITLVIGLLGLLLAFLSKRVHPVENNSAIQVKQSNFYPATAYFLTIAFIISGFTSFSYEIIYARLLAFIIGNRVFASTTMITAFIFGIAFGSLVIGRIIDKTGREPFVFSLFQIIIGITTFLTLLFFNDFVSLIPVIESSLKLNVHWQYIIVRFSEAFLIMIIPSFSFGAIFPSVIKYLNKNIRAISISIGKAYALNTLGCITGALLTAFVLIPALGTFYSMLFISVLSVVLGHRFLAVHWERTTARRKLFSVFTTAALIVIMIFCAVHFKKYPWERKGMDLIYFYEDSSSLVTVYTGELGYYQYTDNTIVTFPIGNTAASAVQRLQAQIPLLVHKNPKDVLVVGLGYGVTTGAFAEYDSINMVETVEIVPGVIRAVSLFREFNNDVDNLPNSKIYSGDGRYYLKHTDKKYDIISSNVCESDLPGSASCYTVDYFKLAKQKLKKDGLFCIHFFGDYGPILIKSLKKEFRYVDAYLAYSQTLFFVASQTPFDLNEDLINARLTRNKKFREDTIRSGLLSYDNLEKRRIFVSSEFDQVMDIKKFPLNTDDKPILEYAFNPNRPNIFETSY